MNSEKVKVVFLTLVLFQSTWGTVCPRDKVQDSLKYIGSYGSKSYYVGDNLRLSWSDAWEFCRAHNMFLPSIESSMENQFVHKFLGLERKESDWWLAGNDFVQEGKFIWMSSGREFTFLNWSPGNPNNANEGEHCVQIGANVVPAWKNWNDNNCNSTFFVFCEDTFK